MDLKIVILHEVRQRKANIIRYCLYMESKTNGTNEFIYKTEIESHTHIYIYIENKHGYQE